MDAPSVPPPPPGFKLDQPEHERSFGENALEFAKGVGKGLAETGQGFEDVTTFGLNKLVEPKNERQEFEKAVHAENTPQELGKAAETVGEMFIPIPGLSEVKAAEGAGTLAKMGVAAAREAADVGIRTAAKTGSPKEAAESAAIGGALGAAVPLFGQMLRGAARTQYGKVLHPAGRAAKEVTDAKLLPGEEGNGVKGVGSILSQGKRAMGASRDSLANKFSEQADKATVEMNQAYSALGAKAKLNLNPIIGDIAKFVKQRAMLPNGNISDKALYSQGLGMIQKLIQDTHTGGGFADANISDVRRFRQILDRQLFQKKLKINPTTARDEIKEAMRGSIQSAIHTQHPTTEDVDARVHFWKTAARLMNDSAKSEVGKGTSSHALHLVGRGATGALIGEEVGRREGGTSGAVGGAIAGAALSEAMASTGWRTVSAVTKNKIADLIVSGKGQAAADLAARAAGIASATRQKAQ